MDCGEESNGDAEGGNWGMQGHGSEMRHGLEPQTESELERMRAADCALLTDISMATMWA